MSTLFKTAPVNDWLKVAEKKDTVLISHEWIHTVHVYVGTTVPDQASAYHPCRANGGFGASGISATDVYIRSGARIPLEVTVTAV
ncbi:hypothetical protein [Rhizobium straminoryzae]|uniref:Uncharacterized protein n=1 Tax=Rhizobium straminoryzae TaxID=1387186 RepID=A0A549T0U0_9HYPH|nr:hypothetical protein [Rhizobium straminoryzae]TRL35480.1 hypothetical protein FNA46_19965 [Rhizobium straminoryzae]